MDPTQGKTKYTDWSMTFGIEAHKLLTPLIQSRRLKPMDFMVLSFLQWHIETKTGRINVRTKDIGEALCLTDSHLSLSLKRLRKEGLLVKGLRGTGYYWMLDPGIWHVGGPRLFEQRDAQFQRLLNE